MPATPSMQERTVSQAEPLQAVNDHAFRILAKHQRCVTRRNCSSYHERGEAADGTIMDIAGHVSHRMLKHYSHIGMEAKRRAVDSLVKKPARVVIPRPEQISNESARVSAKVELLN